MSNNQDQQSQEPNQEQPQEPKSTLNTYARFTGVGFQMLVIIGLGVFAGIKLDQKFPNNYQTFTIICSLASIGIALYTVIKQVSNFSNKTKNSNDQRNR